MHAAIPSFTTRLHNQLGRGTKMIELYIYNVYLIFIEMKMMKKPHCIWVTPIPNNPHEYTI